MEEVLDVYQRPYDPKRPVVCLDQARRQLISETRTGFTDAFGSQHVDMTGPPMRYKREGVAEIFMVAQPLAGRREIVVTESHNSHEWAKVVGRISEEWFVEAERITLGQLVSAPRSGSV